MSREITISAAMRRAGVNAINSFDEAYFSKGGYAEVQEKLENKREGVAAHIYKLATRACDNTDTLKQGLALFQETCAYAEDRYKEKHDISNVKTRMPAWAQFKSRIVRSMRFGLDPREYGSERALRDALSKAIEAKKERDRKRAEREQANITRIDNWLEGTGVHSRLRTVMSHLLLETEYVRPTKRREAEHILQEAVNRIAELVDHKKIKDDADKAAMQKIAA